MYGSQHGQWRFELSSLCAYMYEYQLAYFNTPPLLTFVINHHSCSLKLLTLIFADRACCLLLV